MGQVRAILWQHLHRVHPEAPPCPATDPNDLLEAADLAAALPSDENAQRQLGAEYARLWARTFKTLVRHLRGRPDQTLRVITSDVLPYLRNDRLAARADRAEHGWRLVIDPGLPLAYVAGITTGILEATGARATATVDGQELHVVVRLMPRERIVAWVRAAAQLRLPLLVTSFLAAAVGLAVAHADISVWQITAVLLGTLAAQSAANASHDLRRRPDPHPFHAQQLGRPWLWFQATGSYGLAGLCLSYLAARHPIAIVFAVVGVAISASYAAARDRGLGPVVAGITHGPLIVWGAAAAVGSSALLATPGPAMLLAVPTGATAAALVLLDDLSDRPLDEAAGRRTLVVRLAPDRSIRLFQTTLLTGWVGLAVWVAIAGGPLWLLATTALLALTVGAIVGRHADDPGRLSAARLLLFSTYALSATTLILSLA